MESSNSKFFNQSLSKQISLLYQEGSFVMSIRYYGYKINLYRYSDELFEVFYNHKLDRIDKIELLDQNGSRMKFYLDQIKLPVEV